MQSVKFKSTVLDKDTRFEYPASDEFVEVSDTFADRLRESDPKGERFQFEGVEYEQAEEVVVTADNSELLAKIEKLEEEKHELVAEKLTVSDELIGANELLEQQKSELEVKDAQIAELSKPKEGDLFSGKPKK